MVGSGHFPQLEVPDQTNAMIATPPPGLAQDHGVAAWHFKVADGRVHGGPGVLQGADVTVHGRYQVLMGYAQIVYAAGQASVARQRRELLHRFDGEAPCIVGELPQDASVTTLLSGLHDHLTARTIENPHFDHRVGQLGLADHVSQLADQWYAIVERAITPQFADELCGLTAAEILPHHPVTTNGLVLRDRRFEELAQNTPVCTLAQSAVGQNMILGAMSGTYKEAGPGAIPLHTDYALIRDPYPEFGMIAVAVWALQDWDNTDVGPTWVLPESHRFHRAPRPDQDVDGAVPILMPKGSALLISHGIWHWQGDRTAPDVTYNRVFVRPLDDFAQLEDACFERNPPAFSTLMGRDDPFGKSSFRGHDGKRFAYAGRHTKT